MFGFEQEKRALTRSHLYDAMRKLQPPIKFKQSDRTEVLIKNIIDTMSLREVASMSGGQTLQGSETEQRSNGGADVVPVAKKQRVDNEEALAIAGASEGPSGDLSTPAKLAAAIVPADAHA